MSLGPTFTVPKGTSRDFLLQVKDATDEAVAFLVTDTLTATVWPGDDREAVATPTAAWSGSDYATGKYLLTFADATTASVDPGKYRLRVTFTRSGRTGVLLDGWLVVSASPDDAEAGQALTTLDDLLKYAPWLDDLMSESDQMGFAEQQADAFDWLVDVLCDRWRTVGTVSLGDRTVVGYEFTDAPSTWLRGKLTAATSALIPRGKTVEVLAKKAIAFVCEAQIGRESAKDFAAHARAYHGDADSLLKTYRAELDTKDTYTGVPTMTIHCGTQGLR